MKPTFEEEVRAALARIEQNTHVVAIRAKVLYDVKDVAFLTGFSKDTVYDWIRVGRSINGMKKRVFLKPASGLDDRGFRIFPDELDDFLSHFPPMKA
ncbi:helix-turn-helix domain-containing protein [Larkinella bovis]|uniref:Helix-turn-helix domain-containing protein n=1 Tax=Larkinella bovis TaxID=683041 RepID=A0ABW0I6I9_9BACT